MNLSRIADLHLKPDFQMPCEDYYEYFHDMQKFTGGHLNFDRLFQNPGCSFLCLIEELMQEYPFVLSQLQNADLIIFTHCAYEYDIKYSHVGVILAEKYQLQAELLDIIVDDNKVDVAFHIASAYLSTCVKSKILIMMLEQTGMPLCSDVHIQLPAENSVCLFTVSE